MTSQAEDRSCVTRLEAEPTIPPRAQKVLAAGSVMAALASMSCCILPLVLFGLGVSGAWIGNLTRLAPYQPYFLAATALCLGGGYWLLYRARTPACTADGACARPLPHRIVTIALALATILAIGAVSVDYLAPLFY